ncbi:Ymd8 protein [Starmerella bacillaris]|uniref:Ymd8 protein n=1 Tax=Starmerella bacillaris TaxID=1247836 RepID=A0AAV5RHW0_STABA|nr:Ymd8 protein [Starmerella bacillaris]
MELDTWDPESHKRSRSSTISHSGDLETNIPDLPEDDLVSEPQNTSLFQTRALVSLCLWYTFSIAVSVYNKYLLNGKGLHFECPLFMTAFHQLLLILLSVLAIRIFKLPIQHLNLTDRVKIIPATIASAMDIGLSNTSLLFVTLSFYTMIKTSALGFVLLFSVIFKLEVLTLRLVVIVAVMSLGVFMMVMGEAEFSVLGFLLVLGASAASGLRWSLIKIFLEGKVIHKPASVVGKRSTKPHPVQTILALAPGMLVLLVIWACIEETPAKLLKSELWNSSPFVAVGLLVFPGFLVFGMTWSEFELLNCTSPLTLVIAGIMKEIMTIVISTLAFKDHISLVNVCGLILALLAVAAYHYYRV